jgi:hypothetical protein
MTTQAQQRWSPFGLQEERIGKMTLNGSGHIFAGTLSRLCRCTNSGNLWNNLCSVWPVRKIHEDWIGQVAQHIIASASSTSIWLFYRSNNIRCHIASRLRVCAIAIIPRNGHICAGIGHCSGTSEFTKVFLRTEPDSSLLSPST